MRFDRLSSRAFCLNVGPQLCVCDLSVLNAIFVIASFFREPFGDFLPSHVLLLCLDLLMNPKIARRVVCLLVVKLNYKVEKFFSNRT